LAGRLDKLGVPWIELREPRPGTSFGSEPSEPVSPVMRRFYSGKIVLNSDYDRETAQQRLDEGVADAIAFGRPFIANPDLVERIRRNRPLNTPDVPTFYSGGAEGYIDYPGLEELAA
jgi:N-ethylmaleimide reductase